MGVETLVIASLVSTAVAGVSSFAQGQAQADAVDQQRRLEEKQFQMQVEQEQLNAALEKKARERELQRTLATQRAIFGGAGIESFTGTALNLQNESISNAQSDQNIANLNEGLAVSQLNLQKSINNVGRTAEAAAFRSRGGQSLISSAGSVAGGYASAKQGGVFE